MTGKRRNTVRPENETKRQKSIRLGNARLIAAHQKVRLIGNLATSAYEFTPADVAHFKKVLQNIVDETMAKFDRTAPAAQGPELLAAE